MYTTIFVENVLVFRIQKTRKGGIKTGALS